MLMLLAMRSVGDRLRRAFEMYRESVATDARVERLIAKVQVKAAGGVRDLDGLIKVRDLGATRCGASATVAMLDEYHRREKSGDIAAPPAKSANAVPQNRSA